MYLEPVANAPITVSAPNSSAVPAPVSRSQQILNLAHQIRELTQIEVASLEMLRKDTDPRMLPALHHAGKAVTDCLATLGEVYFSRAAAI